MAGLESSADAAPPVRASDSVSTLPNSSNGTKDAGSASGDPEVTTIESELCHSATVNGAAIVDMMLEGDAVSIKCQTPDASGRARPFKVVLWVLFSLSLLAVALCLYAVFAWRSYFEPKLAHLVGGPIVYARGQRSYLANLQARAIVHFKKVQGVEAIKSMTTAHKQQVYADLQRKVAMLYTLVDGWPIAAELAVFFMCMTVALFVLARAPPSALGKTIVLAMAVSAMLVVSLLQFTMYNYTLYETSLRGALFLLTTIPSVVIWSAIMAVALIN